MNLKYSLLVLGSWIGIVSHCLIGILSQCWNCTPNIDLVIVAIECVYIYVGVCVCVCWLETIIELSN